MAVFARLQTRSMILSRNWLHGFGDRPHSKSSDKSAASPVWTALTRCVPNDANCNTLGTVSYSAASAGILFVAIPFFFRRSSRKSCGLMACCDFCRLWLSFFGTLLFLSVQKLLFDANTLGGINVDGKRKSLLSGTGWFSVFLLFPLLSTGSPGPRDISLGREFVAGGICLWPALLPCIPFTSSPEKWVLALEDCFWTFPKYFIGHNC